MRAPPEGAASTVNALENGQRAGTGSVHPDDVLLGLFVLGPTTSGPHLFPTSSPRLHQIMDSLRQAPEVAGLLDEFEVLAGAPYPYSPQLARSLAHLERSRLIGKHNPDFEHFFVADDAREVFDRAVAGQLPPGTREQLAALATRFWESVRRA